MYTDDLLICLSEPEISFPNLLNCIKHFVKLSGFMINWEKSEFMPITDHFCPKFLSSLTFKLVTISFTYLGLKILKNPKLLYKLNFLEMLDKLKEDIRKWKLLPLSLIG